MIRSTGLPLFALAGLLAGSVPILGADGPLAVSPGEGNRFVRLRDGCPTLSWAEVPGARGYEIEVSRVGEDGRVEEVALEIRVPGRALSWSPGAEQCLARAGRYAWSVRALIDEGASEWSQARLFEIDAQPSPAEVEAALRVIERYLAAGRELPESRAAGGISRRRSNDRRTAGAKSGAAAVAISGEVGGTSGANYGVEGISHSPDGAGLAAENTDPAGADLLLEGTEPAKVTESGLARASASDVTFDFANPGGGAMKLRVDGVDVVTTATDQNTTYLPGNQLNLNGATFDVVEGAGSGLDADTLDGLDSTAFLPGGADNWVNTTGDTMTGTLALDPAAGFALTTGAGKDVNLGGDLFRGGTRFLHAAGTANTALGLAAVPATSTGTENTAVGFEVLRDNSTGTLNTAVGASALRANTTGTRNTAVGRQALLSNTTGHRNTALGTHTLYYNLTGKWNTATGHNALAYNTTGTANTGVGTYALLHSTTSNNNTALGFAALAYNTTGANNAAAGGWALYLNSTGGNNAALGAGALYSNTEGNQNVASGAGALYANTTGSRNVGIGPGAGQNVVDGNDNVFVSNPGVPGDSGTVRIGTTGTHARAFVAGISGVTIGGPAAAVVVDASGQLGTAAILGAGIDADTVDGQHASAFMPVATDNWVNATGDTMSGTLALDPAAGVALTTGSGDDIDLGGKVLMGGASFLHSTGIDNTALGIDALSSVTTGFKNTAMGTAALSSNSTGDHNTAIGRQTMRANTTGQKNTAIGSMALVANTEGQANTAAGHWALGSNTTGGDNTATGYSSLINNTEGWGNTAIGRDALSANTTGSQNVAGGQNALAAISTGSQNIGIGFRAGESATVGSNNIFVANAGTAADSGVIRIGTGGTHTSTFVAGISGVATSGAALPVVVDGSGQLGTASFGGGGIDADTLDGIDSTSFASTSHAHAGESITSGTVAEARVDISLARDSEILPTVLAGDGSGSTLDADTLDGFDSTAFQPAGRSLNPLQIATLRWWEANQVFPAIGVGTSPFGLAFDGTHVWVTNQGSGDVTKLRASDGSIVGTYAVGGIPQAIAFDGTHIWVANSGSNNVTKLRADDGSVVGTYPVGSQPTGIAFDGTSIWVTNISSGNVTRLAASDGSLVDTYDVGPFPGGIAFDGANIWIAIGESVIKLRASDGGLVATVPVGSYPTRIAFDGAHIWVAMNNFNTVTKIRAADGTVVGGYPVGHTPFGVAFDGTSIWVVCVGDNSVTKLRASDGSTVGTYPTGNNPYGIAFDGTNIWVANQNSNTVSRM